MEPKSYFKSTCANCGGHIEAPAEGAGMWIRCPHCGEKMQLTGAATKPTASQEESTSTGHKSSPAVLWSAVIVAVLVAAGAALLFFKGSRRETQQSVADHPAQTVPVAAARKPAPQPDLWKGLKPSSVTIENAPKSRLVYAVGTIRNDTDKQRFGVKVLLDILDAQGENLGTTTDYTQFVDAHKDWTFKALVAFPKAATAKVHSITEE